MRKILTILLFLCVSASGQFFTPHQKPMLGLQINRAHQLGDPVALWLENEGSGNKVFDLSGNDFHLTGAGGPTWTAGKFGSVTRYSAASNQYFVRDIPAGTIQPPYTVNIWLKAGENNPAAIRTAFFYGDASEGADYVEIGFLTNGQIRCRDRDLDCSRTTNADYADDQYHMVTMIITIATNGTVDVYIDGVFEGTDTGGMGGGNYANYDRIAIGMLRDSSATNPYEGDIDNCSIYNRALTSSEIALLYREPFCMFKRNPIISWYTETVIPPDWITITSSHLDSNCGDSQNHACSEALDGTDYWLHEAAETHWFIIDLGQTYNVQKVRGRSNAGDALGPIDVDIYVSNDTGAGGAAVATGINTWINTDAFVEGDTTDKEGRYVKVEIIETEDGVDGDIWFGGADPYFTIFDVYGSAGAAAAAGQLIFINFF